MNRFRHLCSFDWMRMHNWLRIWWYFCALSCLSWLLVGHNDTEQLMSWSRWFICGAYILLACLIGLFVQPDHPGRSNSFFRGKAIEPFELLRTRLFLIAMTVVCPLFVSQLLPVLLVDSSFGSISAFTVVFWGIHLGVVLSLMAMAVLRRDFPGYLVYSLFLAVSLLAVALIVGNRFRYYPELWFLVPSKETAEILWPVGLSLVASISIWSLLRKLYLGNRSRLRLIVTGLGLLVIAGLWGLPQFRQDPNAGIQSLSAEVLDRSDVKYVVRHHEHLGIYKTQRNRGPGSFTGSGISGDSLLKQVGEEYWFISGALEVVGLDAKIAYSARLLDSEWTTGSGESLRYEPPVGTFSITNRYQTLPNPEPTFERLEYLFGPGQEKTSLDASSKTELLLFGAWTSDYLKFKAMPGQLKLRVRIDYYSHDIGMVLPLDDFGAVTCDNGLVSLSHVWYNSDELEVNIKTQRVRVQWSIPNELRWTSNWKWLLYDPEKSLWAKATGSGGGGGYSPAMGVSIGGDLLSYQSRASNQVLPLLDRPAQLQLVGIDARYLGSEEVEIIVEDFSLIPEAAFQMP